MSLEQIVKEYIEEQERKAFLIGSKIRRWGWSVTLLTQENMDLLRKYGKRKKMVGMMEQIKEAHHYQMSYNQIAGHLNSLLKDLDGAKVRT